MAQREVKIRVQAWQPMCGPWIHVKVDGRKERIPELSSYLHMNPHAHAYTKFFAINLCMVYVCVQVLYPGHVESW